MDTAILWRVALVQVVAVALLSLLLGLHWLGALAAVAIFAVACAYMPRPAAG